MQQALLLAKEAANHGDVPVGAIIVDEQGTVIGRGKNERVKNNDPLAHAEIMAIKDAASKLSNWRFSSIKVRPANLSANHITNLITNKGS